MLSLVSIVVLLLVLLLARILMRMWDRRIEAALDKHLRRAREIARRPIPDSDAVD